MLDKNTILFFTETDQTAVADAIREEFPTDGSIVSVVIQKKELRGYYFNKIWTKLVKEDSSINVFLTEKKAELFALRRDGKKKEQKTPVYDNKNFVQRRILNALNRYTPTVVCVTSHVLINDVIAATEHYGRGVKLAVICDDYVLDNRLVNRVADKYFVDNFAMRNELIEEGVAPEKIEIGSLPVLKRFYTVGDKEEARKKLALDPRDTVLISAGRLGDEDFTEVAKAIKESDLDVNVVVACGKDAAFLNAVREMGVYGFNDALDMNVALDACDVLVTRPTNVLIAQALAKSKCVYTLYPANRAEEENQKYLALQSVTAVEDEEELVRKLQAYYAEPAENREHPADEIEKYSARIIASKVAKLGVKRPTGPVILPTPPTPSPADEAPEEDLAPDTEPQEEEDVQA